MGYKESIMSELETQTAEHPRFATHVAGHGHTIVHLQKAFADGRLPHGLLFTGAKGVGKATLAHKIARALLTNTMADLGAPLKILTATDHLLRAGNHPDFLCIEKSVDEKGKVSKDIPVEKARSVMRFFSQTSLENNWRVAIIDSVDDLNTKGANSLLKILEEPPQKCLLILISHNLEGVLPTLRSRSQILQLPPLSLEESTSIFVEKHCENPRFLAKACAGRPGLGLMINDLGGQSFHTAFSNIMQDLAKGDLRSTHGFMENFVLKNKTLTPDRGWQSFVEFLNHWLPHSLSSSQKNIGTTPSILATRSPDKWVESWFTIQTLLRQTHTFSLDKKQTLLCIFHELAGLHQR